MNIRRPARRLLALAAATTLATLLAPAAAQTVPDGMVGINYNRCDGNYDGWGVHLWKNPGIPIPGVEWARPMMPTGKGDFGVYWHVPQAEFGSSGTVNYIIHKGETKDQGGKDMKFDSKTYREVWVNNSDRKIYWSVADAKKARAESPCP